VCYIHTYSNAELLAKPIPRLVRFAGPNEQYEYSLCDLRDSLAGPTPGDRRYELSMTTLLG
jgi:hypothetical protein